MRANTEFFTYGISFLAVAPAAIVDKILTLDASSDFLWLYSAWSAATSGGNTAWAEATRQLPSSTIMLTPGDTNAQMMSQAVPVGHIFGSGEMPFVLPAPRKLPARTTLEFVFTNLDSTITYDIYLSLIGVKQYRN